MEYVLGLRGLPAVEAGLIRTILRLSSTLDGQWSVSDEGPCDVMLLDEAADSICPDASTAVVRVRRRGDGSEPAASLHRPIRAEELIDLLNAQVSRHRGRASFAAIAQPVSMPIHRKARLQRWPSQVVLGRNSARIQLATFLSRHAMSAQRLAAVAARPLAECEAFMRELDARGLLSWQPEPALAAAAGTVQGLAIAGSAVVAAPASQARQPQRGLFSRLRSKLGIARALS